MSLGGDRIIRNVFKTAIIKKSLTVLSLGAVLLSFSGTALADQYDDQIAAAQAAAAAATAQANAAGAQVSTYQGKVDQLNAQIDALQAQINLTSIQLAQLNASIDQATAELAGHKVTLGADIKQMYLDSGVTPLEMLASSENISDFMNKQQYQDKVQAKIQTEMSSIVALQKQLAQQQAAAKTELASEQSQQAQVQASEAQVNQLLAVAQQDASSANSQVQSENAQIRQLKAAQAAQAEAIERSTGGGNSGTVGSFVFKNWTGNEGACAVNLIDCNYAQDSVIDPWNLYNRECVSYAAWEITQMGGSVPAFHGNGNAYQWLNDFPSDTNPSGGRVVAIAPQGMIAAGDVGHAMVVQQVYGNGWIHVSQYNWGETGQYSEMDVKIVPGLRFIHF